MPAAESNSAPDAVDLAAAYGLVLDDWQCWCLAAALGERADGKWQVSRAGFSIPRQNGKGAIIEAVELAGLFLFGEQTIVHSAHEHKTARDGFVRLLSYFENYDDLRGKVRRVGAAVSREYIELKSGQSVRFFTRSKSAGRGFPLDRLIFDEAQELSDAQWDAMVPTKSARPNPQAMLFGTPPSPQMNSDVFTRYRANGLAGGDDRLAWVEWSAEPGDDLDDPATWAKANPSLGVTGRPNGTGLSVESFFDDRADMSDDGFARERCGVWQPVRQRAAVIPHEFWTAAADERSLASGRLALGVEAAPDLAGASVAVAGMRADGTWHVELDEQRGGVDWLVPYVAALVEANPAVRAVVADAGAPVSALFADFERAGVRLVKPKVVELGQACSRVLDGVVTGQLRHTGQPQLAAAVAAAGKRRLGDTGMWVWSRSSAASDITPVQAVTLALWGAQLDRVKAPGRGSRASGPRRERRALVL